MLRRLEEQGARAAVRKVIGYKGWINKQSRYAPNLLPDLVRLNIRSLLMLKLHTWLRSVWKK
jgi:hypothetical protein